jgi:hypothetical protein
MSGLKKLELKMWSSRIDMIRASTMPKRRIEIEDAHWNVINALTRAIKNLKKDTNSINCSSRGNRTQAILTTHRDALLSAYEYESRSSGKVSREYFDAITRAAEALQTRQIHCRKVWTAFKILIGLVLVGFAAGIFASLAFFTPVAVPAGATAAYAAAAFLINLKFGLTLCGGAIPFFGGAAFFLPMNTKNYESHALKNLVGKLNKYKNALGDQPQEDNAYGYGFTRATWT